jgi:hypothetical protein
MYEACSGKEKIASYQQGEGEEDKGLVFALPRPTLMSAKTLFQAASF